MTADYSHAFDALFAPDAILPCVREMDVDGTMHVAVVDTPGKFTPLCNLDVIQSANSKHTLCAVAFLRGGDSVCQGCQDELAIAAQEELPGGNPSD